jgi:hypothetical protein
MMGAYRLSLLVAAVLGVTLAGLGRDGDVAASGSPSATAVALGWIHTCALTEAGGVMCWGFNAHNELGDGTRVDRWRPVGVSGVGGGIRAIATGARHGCALTGDVHGLNGSVTALALGGRQSCALLAAGEVKCWGGNIFGQLGDGTTRRRLTPVDVTGLTAGVTAIAAGDAHTCALMRTGGMKCWGYNDWAQLGDGTSVNRLRPVDVSGMGNGVTAISAGALHSCARTRTGNAKCWGDNENGQLGDGTPEERSRPVYALGLGPAPVTLSIVPASPTVTRERVVAVKLRCGAAGSCHGQLWLSARLRLGSRAFAFDASTTAVVRVKLDQTGFNLLAREGRLLARAHVRLALADGTTSEQSRPITLKAP